MQAGIEIEKKWIDHPVRAFKKRTLFIEKSFCIGHCQVNIQTLFERDCLAKNNYLKSAD